MHKTTLKYIASKYLDDDCDIENNISTDQLLLSFVTSSCSGKSKYDMEFRVLNIRLALRHAIAYKDEKLIQKLVEEIEKICKKQLFDNVLSNIYLTLIQYYSGLRDANKLQVFIDKHEACKEEAELYEQVKKYASLVNFYLNNNQLDQKSDEIKCYIIELREIISSNHNCTIQKHFGFMQLVYFWHNRDYLAIRDTCLRYILLLQESTKTPEKHLSLFYSNLSIAQLYLKDYKAAIQTLNCSAKYMKIGSHNWAKEQIVKVAVHNYNHSYTDAYQITLEVVNHKNFKKLRRVVQEEWHIICAFMSLLIKLGKINPDVTDQKISGFRLNKFLNEIPIYSKDKAMTNATILIAHICHLIVDKKYNLAIDRIEAIERYCSRYLITKSESFRLNCFLKMLLVIPKAGFHKAAVSRYAEKFERRLAEQSIAETRQNIITEIIPFDVLWEMILNRLFNRNYKPR